MSSLNHKDIRINLQLIKSMRVSGLDSIKNNVSLISSIWRQRRKRVFAIFKILRFTEHFRVGKGLRLGLHLNKQYCNSFNAEKNLIEFNLLTFLCNLTSNHEVYFTEDFLSGHYLIHEFDHYLYCADNDGIGLSENEQTKWDEIHDQPLEIRAMEMQIKYLDGIREIYSPKYFMTRFEKDDQVTLRGVNLYSIIDQLQNGTLEAITEVKKGRENYYQYAESKAVSTVVPLGRLLKVRVDLSEGEEYERVTLQF